MNQSELSHMAGAVDDSTINIAVVIIIIIITSGSLKLSASKFQRDGPATEKARGPSARNHQKRRLFANAVPRDLL